MSWIEQIQEDFIITTGDGKEYRPNWLNAQRSVEYNIAEFDFPDIPGSLVTRKAPKGARYNLEIYFQGENHLDTSEAFRASADDPRPWTLSHPMYGRLLVQPVSLAFDDTLYNRTKITGTLIETISEDHPKGTIEPRERILADKEAVDQAFENTFDIKPTSEDVNTLTDNNAKLYSNGSKVVKTAEQAEVYFNLFNKANAAVLNATAEPLLAIRAMQDVITYPFQFETSVKSRISLLKTNFDRLSSGVSNIIGRNEKKVYENNAGEVVNAMAASSATPVEGDYQSRDEVLNIIEQLLSTYDEYLENLDELSSDNGGDEDSYIPDAAAMIALNDLVVFTVSSLFQIAIGSKQERSIILEEDSNVVVLAHRFYGLQADDSTIDYLINTNSIGLNELFNTRKGRTIKYYV